MRESKANDRLLRNLNGLLALIHFKLHLQTYILIRAPMSHHDSVKCKNTYLCLTTSIRIAANKIPKLYRTKC